MISLIVIRVCFLFQVFSFILFWNSMCKVMCVCLWVCMCVYMIRFKQTILIAVNSPVCYIWIVNGRTDSNTYFLSRVSFFVFQNNMFKDVCTRECARVCVCVAVNSYGSYIWIVNDITDSNICINTSFKKKKKVCFLLSDFRIVCVRRCVCLCVAVNSHGCYIWIVNDITDSNFSLFSVSVFVLSVILFQNSMCKEVC